MEPSKMAFLLYALVRVSRHAQNAVMKSCVVMSYLDPFMTLDEVIMSY